MIVYACTVDETCGMADPVPDEDMSWHEVMSPIIDAAASSVYWQHRKWVELDDVKQEGWLAYLTNRKVLDALMESEAGRAYVKRRIHSAMSTYAVREMCHRTGLEWEDQYSYSKGEIRSLVTLVLSGGPAGFEPESVIAGYADVKAAIEGCDPGDRVALWLAYGTRSDEGSPLSSNDRSRARRAIARLQRKLNGEDEPTEE